MATNSEQATMGDDAKSIALDSAGETTLPVVELLTGRGFVTGKSGSGKSNTASVIVEELLDRGFPVMIVDTDGEYWGLKEEYEILHVGADEECDLQVGPEHAEKLADLALEQSVPIILDVSGYLEADDASALVRETASALFSKEKKLNKPFLLLVEEIHEYLPEGAGSDDTARMLTRVAKRGRKRGLGLCGMSQRPADVKKDFITQCDWLMWHRLTWENDTKVVGRVIGNDYKEPVQDLADGEAFLMADFLADDIQRVQVRRKRTFDAGATPDLGDYERPELKSVGSDLVSELEEITDRQERREDELERLRDKLDEKDARIDELEEELESAQDMRDMASQFAEAMQSSGGDGDVASEKVDELIEERNHLRSEVEDREGRISELESRVSELQNELEQRPDIGERAIEAVGVLADEFGVGGESDEALRRKLKSARERIDELEGEQSAREIDSNELENPKVQRYIREMKSRVTDLDDYQEGMLWYYMLEGPDSNKEAYKYAGGSPTSSAVREKNNELVDTGLVKKIKKGEYDYGLPEHADEQLGDYFDQETIRAVVEKVEKHIESAVTSEDGQ